MIPYDELDRALARWKSRQSSGATQEPVAAEPAAEPGAMPETLDGLPPPIADNTGEIDLGDEAVESYDDER